MSNINNYISISNGIFMMESTFETVVHAVNPSETVAHTGKKKSDSSSSSTSTVVEEVGLRRRRRVTSQSSQPPTPHDIIVEGANDDGNHSEASMLPQQDQQLTAEMSHMIEKNTNASGSYNESISTNKTKPKGSPLYTAFLRIPLCAYWSLLMLCIAVFGSVLYILETRFGRGHDAIAVPLYTQSAAADASVMEIVAELPAPPG
jgi:hypothetical protein